MSSDYDDEDSTHAKPITNVTGISGQCPICGHPLDDCKFTIDGYCSRCEMREDSRLHLTPFIESFPDYLDTEAIVYGGECGRKNNEWKNRRHGNNPLFG